MVFRKQFWLIIGVILLLGWGLAYFSRPAAAIDAQIVVVKTAANTDAAQLAADYQATLLDSVAVLSLHRLQANGTPLWEGLASDPRVVWLRPDGVLESRPHYLGAAGGVIEATVRYIDASVRYIDASVRYIDASGNEIGDPYRGQTAALNIRLAQAHTIATGEGIVVAVLDSGVDGDHPLLADVLTSGYDFVDDDADPSERLDGLDNDGDGLVDEAAGHGTHVAGVIRLAAPDATIMPVRIFDTEGHGSYLQAAAGIVYAVDQGAQVINLSGNGAEASLVLQEAVDYAWQHGVLLVSAVGDDVVGYPGLYPQVISVGAVDEFDYLTDFSRFQNADVTVYAPGTGIFSAYLDGQLAWWTGHSMAAPFVAGEAALMLSTGSCDYLCVFAGISQATRPLGDHHTQHLSGRLDMYDAVAAAANQPEVNLKVQYRSGSDDSPADQAVKPYFKIINQGNSVALNDLTLRYWYDPGQVGQLFYCDYAAVGCGQVTAVFSSTTTYPYAEIRFNGNQMLLGGRDSGGIQLRIHKASWAAYNESGHYSYQSLANYVDWDRVTLYYRGELVWGNEPTYAFVPPTPVPTPSATPTLPPTPSPTPPPVTPTPAASTTPAGLSVQYYPFANAANNEIKAHLQIVNGGSSPIPLSELTLRYWFTETVQAVSVCDYAMVSCGNVTAVFGSNYVQIGFGSGAGMVGAAGGSGDVQVRIRKSNWGNFNKAGHYSYNPAYAAFANWERVTLYRNGVLVWGVEP